MLSALAKRLDFNHNEDAWPRVCTCVRICEILLFMFIHIYLFVCVYVCMYVCMYARMCAGAEPANPTVEKKRQKT